MKKWQFKIPYEPSLDDLPLSEVAVSLEDHGERLSVDSLNWPVEFPYRPLTVVTAAHSGKFIYIDFFVRCNYLRAVNSDDNTPVSEDSCVEFYVAPVSGDGGYFCFEVNCIGAVNAYRRGGKGDDGSVNESLSQLVKRYASVGPRPFCEVEGSFTWNVVMAVPLEVLGVRYQPGSPVVMHGNFNKCASATSQPHYLSWSPVKSPAPDFHHPEYFGELLLE